MYVIPNQQKQNKLEKEHLSFKKNKKKPLQTKQKPTMHNDLGRGNVKSEMEQTVETVELL